MKLSTILGKNYENIVNTLTEEEIFCVVDGLKKKNVKNPLTIRFALDYLYSHKKVYGDIIDTMEVAENIVRNLNKDIVFSVGLFYMGKYSPKEGQIELSFLTTVKSFLPRKRKCNILSVLRHEFDHCATDKRNNGKAENGFGINFRNCGDDAHKMLNGVDGEILEKLFPERGLVCLDEGITVFKERRFDEANGSKPNRQSNYYEIFLGVAEHIANVIGEKKMVKFHYDGDFRGMCEEYSNKIGMNLAVVLGHIGYCCSGYCIHNYKYRQWHKKELEEGNSLLTYLKNAEKDLLGKQKEAEKE